MLLNTTICRSFSTEHDGYIGSERTTNPQHKEREIGYRVTDIQNRGYNGSTGLTDGVFRCFLLSCVMPISAQLTYMVELRNRELKAPTRCQCHRPGVASKTFACSLCLAIAARTQSISHGKTSSNNTTLARSLAVYRIFPASVLYHSTPRLTFAKKIYLRHVHGNFQTGEMKEKERKEE